MRYTKSFIIELKEQLIKAGVYQTFSITPEFVHTYLESIDKYYDKVKELFPLSVRRQNKAIKVRANYVARGLLVVQHERDGSAASIKAGYLYAITNPAYPGWYKIGETIDVVDRLNSYQTYDPHRSFELVKYVFVFDRKEAEKVALNRLSCTNEWVYSTYPTISEVLKSLTNFEVVESDVLRIEK